MPKKPSQKLWIGDMGIPRSVGRPPLNRIYIGIDPGQNGGLCLVTENGVRELHQMPDSERDVWQWFANAKILYNGEFLACIEKVHSMPEQGVASSFKFGQGYGFLLGCLHGAGIPFETVTPQAWQKGLAIPPHKKDEKQPQFKNRLREHAQRLFPQLEIWSEPRSKGKQLAISDALLISHYCKLKNQGT